MLVRIWDEIHDDRTDLSKLIEGLQGRFGLQVQGCDYCTKAKMPLKHYAAAIVLCRLARSASQNLLFWPKDGEKHTAYRLSYSTGDPSYQEEKSIETADALKDHLKEYNTELLAIWEKPYDEDHKDARAAERQSNEAIWG